jgi:methyl-accepting chemotaxis protein
MNEEITPLDKILNIFSGIDDRIMFLHQCSSDDFLSLNKALKENYYKARFITEKAGLMFEKAGDQGNLKTLGLLKKCLSSFQQDLMEFETETDQTLASLERIQANFSLMFVPINNFRQNLASLKLLLSNIKLTNTYFDKSLKSFSESEAIQIDKIINKVKDSCPVFEENIYNIRKHIKELYTELLEVKNKVLSDVMKNFEIMQSDIEIIEKHSKSATRYQERIDEISQNCNKSVEVIITNLQYHDIIRQKMEHIQKTHKYLVEEINDEEMSAQASGRKNGSHVLQIPQISDIQVGQLMYTNKEYQQAIEQITSKLIDMGKDMTEVVRTCKMLNVFEYKGLTVESGTFNEQFRNFTQQSKKSLDKYVNLANDITLVNRIVTDLYHKYQDIDMMESAIEQRIIDKISFGDLLVSPEKETASQAQQILKLYADNHFEKNKIKTLFESTRVELKEFICRNMEYVGDRKGIVRLGSHITEALEHFKTIKENLGLIESIQEELSLQSEEISNTNKLVTDSVKYYDSFETTIDQLIAQFEQISTIIRNKNPELIGNNGNKKKSLEQIEKYYTMKSERLVHNHSLMQSVFENGVTGVIDQMIQETRSTKGSDMEIF